MNGGAILVGLAILSPIAAAGQSLNGNAEWGYARSAYRTASGTTADGAFTQAYTLGYASSLWDPRFAVYSGGVTFNRNALTFGADTSESAQAGFNAAASLFSLRPFRLALRASRAAGAESANYPAANLLRGGLPLDAGTLPELRTGQSEYGLNWVLAAPALPRVEFSYQQAAGTVAAGPLAADQTSRSVQALVSRDGPRLTNTLRYQRHAADNTISTAFAQRYEDLGYELVAKASDRTRADVRAGRRTTATRFQAPLDALGGDAYRPPAGGDTELYYGSATLTHQRNARFSTDASLGYNSERSDAAGTGALLATATAHLVPFSGATLRGRGTYGRRRQEIGGERSGALTRAIGGGAEYGVRHRAMHATAGYDTEEAWNRGDTLVGGRARSWRARADAGVDLLTIAQISAGYDRDRSVDELLTLGNQSLARTHAAARTIVTPRVVIDGNYERASGERGVAPLRFAIRYSQALANATFQVARERRAAITAGEFVNRSFAAGERHRYFGASFTGAIAGPLHLSVTARRERTMADAPRLDQDGYYTVGSLDYRLRLFSFAVEYRYTDLALTTASQIDPLTFSGNQLALRIGRQFGMGR